MIFFLQNRNKTLYLQSQNERNIFNSEGETKREISSAGSEHLVYTEGVGGSNPSFPTKSLSLQNERLFFVLLFFRKSRWSSLGSFNFDKLYVV